ncbi:hypothetical protein ELQ92_04705 [Labedella populi]|uniref:Uncharacterized protein n=1 Tax=Labedella populi TaxID=2498850 RepID=A0A444QG44_9MICO|nr:hypothetical protein [Labedella populi]RWZ68514.1 hypothetical protein ELQ92_04705 [Labedella populi]
MIRISRYTMLALAGLFSLYHVFRGVITLGVPDSPWPSIVAMVLYIGATIISLWPTSPVQMPLSLAFFNLAVSITLCLLVTSELDPGADNGYATWHVASIGTLMTITAARRREWTAWAGVGFLTIQSIVWAGIGTAAAIGVTGSVTWVAIAVVIARALARAGRDAEKLVLAERAAAEWQAAQDAHFTERARRLDEASRLAGPTLRRIVLSGGDLTPDERMEARLLEAGLRDEIRGRRLLNLDVRREVLAARRRGTMVSLLDEGTIDDLPQEELDRVLAVVAASVADSTSERLIVRTAPLDSTAAVTLVGLSKPAPGSEDPDDDVDLWREVPRSAAAGSDPGRRSRQGTMEST